MKKTPLILHGGEVVNKVIKLCKMKKFVVLETAGEWIKLTDLSGLKSYEFVLTSFKCCFQGKETQSLRDFNDLIPFWTLNELVLMLDGPYTLDRKETLTHSYINRRLTRHVVDITYLDKIDKNTSVLIDCVNTDLKCLCVDLDQFLNGDSNLEKKFLHFGAVFIKKTPCGSDDFDNLCRKTNSRKSLHFRMDENNLDLIRSKDETDLERFCLNVSIEEDKLLERLGNNINLIINEAGMGKTELLKHWKNEFFEDYWTLLLTPKDMSCVSEHIEGFFDYIVKEKYRDLQDFDKNVLEVFLKKNRVVYLWDALDEISTQNQDKIINLIKKLPRECQQWVTSRPHLKPKLETAFGVPARHLLPLDRDQQIFYIEQVLKWDIGPKMINSDIFAVPLHLFMVSELWQDSQKYQNLSLIDLYRNFIENKKKKLCEKAKLETPNDCLWELFDQNVDDMLEAYEQIAFKSLLSEDLIKKLNINCDHCFKKIKKWKDRLGLLSHFDDSSAQFLHISFAEYLVARYFSTNFEHISHLEFIFLQEFQNVRFFFDLLLAQESQLHVAVLYKDYEFLKQNEDQVRTCRDFGGRNLLQLACSWGQTCPELSVEKVGDVYVIDDQNDLNEITDSQDYVKIVKFLLEICDIEETDCVFKMNTRGYADRANCVLAKIFIEKKKRSCGNILSSRTLCNLLYFSARFGCSETLEVCEKIPIVQTKSKNSLLHLVTSESYLSQLLNKKEYKKLINQVNKFGETPLLVASTNGYDTIVRNLIQSGAMIDICDNDGFSPLHKSCRVGHHNIVDILIQKGAQIDICDKDGDTPLHLAAYHGHDNITEMLILTKTKLDVCDNDGSTPLHKAAYNGHNDVMRRLIESGSQIDVCDHFGRTPLYWAAHNGHVKTVKILIDNGAQIDICDKNNESALYLAAFNGHYDVIQNLLSHDKSQIDVCDDDGSRPLHKAAYNGHERVVTALISLGVQIDSCDKFGRTPLYWAAHNGYVKTVKILIDKGARIDICDKKDGSPLHVAAYNGHDHVVNLISSTIIDNCDRDGSTPLHKACYNGHIKVVDTLLSKGAKIDSCDNYNRTPLYWAAHNGHHKVTNFLIVSGANVDICDHGRWSPLIWAIYNGHKEVVSDLLSGGANVQIWTNEGETPLHKACVKGYSEIAKMLILKGAEIDICDNCGRTPLDIAMQRGFDNVVSLLITSGAKVDPLKYRL
ncbi:uncharacterized protein LOC123008580 [Tribolium madens]|uniref:uncharacterized protein LOC123008580 n=1 Tax=Tribolium madens TaxID=41895 RepID=UPI001CF73563|nr:uncharacterized protein LOC123008580 [Tribolium madens]